LYSSYGYVEITELKINGIQIKEFWMTDSNSNTILEEQTVTVLFKVVGEPIAQGEQAEIVVTNDWYDSYTFYIISGNSE